MILKKLLIFLFFLGAFNFASGQEDSLNIEMALLPAPEILAPESGVSDVNVRAAFEWTKVDTCHYLLQLDTSKAFDETSLISVKIRRDDDVKTIAYVLKEQYLDFEQTYYWRVRAFNDISEGAWSEVRTLSTEEYAFSKVMNNAWIKIVDNEGIWLSVIGYTIVFIALVILLLCINILAKILTGKQRKKLKASGHRAADREDLNISGEINAAIFMALHLHFEEIHDYEDAILTIKKEPRKYSPWSSKIYNIASVWDKR